LVADIGGTNARFAMIDLDDLVVPRFETYPCANFKSLAEAAATFVKDTGAKPKVAAFDIAGPVSGNRGLITNLSWSMTTEELAAATGAKSVLLLNDFEALALSVQLMTATDLRQIGGGAPVERATKGLVGPGTGLGVGGLVWSASRWMPIPGEGGHTSFAAESAEEIELLSTVAKRFDHFSNERVVSGPGLVNLYVCFAARRGITLKERVGANEITRRALANEDPIELLRRVAPRVVTVHASDRRPKPGVAIGPEGITDYTQLIHGEVGTGLIDYDAIFSILRSVNFSGWISIEDGVNGVEELKRSAQFLMTKMKNTPAG